MSAADEILKEVQMMREYAKELERNFRRVVSERDSAQRTLRAIAEQAQHQALQDAQGAEFAFQYQRALKSQAEDELKEVRTELEDLRKRYDSACADLATVRRAAMETTTQLETRIHELKAALRKTPEHPQEVLARENIKLRRLLGAALQWLNRVEISGVTEENTVSALFSDIDDALTTDAPEIDDANIRFMRELFEKTQEQE